MMDNDEIIDIDLTQQFDSATVEKQLQAVSSFQGKNAKLAFNRRLRKMKDLVGQVNEIEEQIAQLYVDKMEWMDEVNKLRLEMVKDCVHPKSHLLHKQTHIICKFCERRISIPRTTVRVPPVEDVDGDTDE